MFTRSGSLADRQKVALNFNVLNLEQIGGFNIVWTESLQDHLSLSIDDTEKELRFFHVASFMDTKKAKIGMEYSSATLLPFTNRPQAHPSTGVP
jgi:hypothetical protein